MSSIINAIIIYSIISFSFVNASIFTSRTALNVINKIQSGISSNRIPLVKKLDPKTEENICRINIHLNENYLKSLNYIRRYQLLGNDDRSKISGLSTQLVNENKLAILSSNGLTYENTLKETSHGCKDIHMRRYYHIPLCERLLLQGIQLSIKADVKQLNKRYLTEIKINKYATSTQNPMSLQDIMREYIGNSRIKLPENIDTTVKSKKIEPIFDPVNIMVEQISAEIKQKVTSKEHGINVPIPPKNQDYPHKDDESNKLTNKKLFHINIPDIQGTQNNDGLRKKLLRESAKFSSDSDNE
ncbi:hypothetical protein FG386_000760 [Cryptosporidium ryanae]|uniref:uncharacterized protein n=1 Tax=Cryptosporidium ryanae TaxID=515981 RepID=UPI00351A697D|nr:hypothetical protein FG386_000760 [Cryptosporidium ryanae]